MEVLKITRRGRMKWAIPRLLNAAAQSIKVGNIQIYVFFLCLLPFVSVYPQSEIKSDCSSLIENIFKAHALKIKYECVQFFHDSKEQKGFAYIMSRKMWSYYFDMFIGFPLVFEVHEDSVSGTNSETIEFVEKLSEEEINRYIEQMGTPQKAFEEYRNLIQYIKSKREIYLKCLDAEVSKGDLSEYAKDEISPYNFLQPGQSLLMSLTKLDFLNVFKKFIFNDNEEVLPDGMRVRNYLNHNNALTSPPKPQPLSSPSRPSDSKSDKTPYRPKYSSL